jgi:3-phytase
LHASASAIDAVSNTDGIAAVPCPLGEAFPTGALVVQDDQTPAGHQNFKMFRWEDIAGRVLLIDTSQTPRGK